MNSTVEAKKLCYGCMNECNDDICPICGFDQNQKTSESYHLEMGSMLSERYMIGRVLGEGGFGITYIGWDKSLEIKVAIKEYYPSGLVTREITGENQGTVSVYTGDKMDSFSSGLERFLNETRRLAKFRNNPGIVGVSDFFEENGTAYMVMDYVAGINMSTYLKQMGGKVPVKQALDMLMPVIRSLEDVHKEGIIHRDISPDNIMVQENGEVRLIDFGAARDFSNENKSLSVVLKPGYAPEEQYRTKGKQGPWTDVYALCATLYKMISGVTPEESMERMAGVTIKKPSELGIDIDPQIENAILMGMELKAENRIQSMADLIRAINGEEIHRNINIQSNVTADAGEKTEFIENNVEFEKLKRDRLPDSAPASLGQKRTFKKVGMVFLAIAAVAIVFGGYMIGTKMTNTEEGSDEPVASASVEETNYAQAEKLYEQGNYQEAGALYKDLGNYNDSEMKYKQSLLKYGEREYLNTNYENAIGALEEVGEFENAKDILSKSYLEYGKSLMNSKEYEKAMVSLEKSSEEGKDDLIKSCQYNEAIDLYNNKKNKKAAAIFSELGDYEDSTRYYGKCMKPYWSKAYKEDLSLRDPRTNDYYPQSFYYALYDIDKNGIPELIIDHWWSSDSYDRNFISTFDGVELIGLDDRDKCQYKMGLKGEGILFGELTHGTEGEGRIIKVTYPNGQPKEEVLQTTYGGATVSELLAAYGEVPIDFYDLTDMTPFKRW